jgi:hypothetical protein
LDVEDAPWIGAPGVELDEAKYTGVVEATCTGVELDCWVEVVQEVEALPAG